MPHITFLTYGTRGDVEPFLALALHFKDMGYDITFAAPSDFKNWVEQQDLHYKPTTRTPIKRIVENPALQDLMNFNLFKIRKAYKTLKTFTFENLVDIVPKIVDKTDLIIAHCGLLMASDIAEKHNVPLVFLSPIPATPTKSFPIVPLTRSLGVLNKATYLPIRLARAFTPSLYQKVRENLQLPPASRFKNSFQLNGKPIPILHIYSPNLCPRPNDWPPSALITGNLFLDKLGKNWQPEPDLAEFLENGPPPVYIGFGSMITGQSENLVEIVLKAAKQANQRLLLSAGWAGLKPQNATKDVFLLGDVPHYGLFPHVKAVVHHGGAGTLAAGLRAGKPTLVCPFGFDQSWWGAIVERKQLGPPPIHQKKLTQENFTEAFSDLVNNTQYAQQAKNLGHLMQKEQGVKKTAQTIIELFELS